MEECSWTHVENADYMSDMETNIRKRKRVRGKGTEACYIPKSDKFDEDYVLFLEGLEEFSHSKIKVYEEDDDDDDDPQYLAFLDNLEEHGNSYKCCVSVEYGVFSPIVYEEEEEEGDCVTVKRKVPKSTEGASSRVKKRVDFDAKTHHFDWVKGKKTTISNGGGFVSGEKRKVGGNLRTSRENSIPRDGVSDGVKRKKTAISSGGGFVSSEKKKIGENLRTSWENSIPQDSFSDGIKGKKTTISSGGGFVSSEKKKVGENLRTSRENSIPQDGFPDKYKRNTEGVAGLKRPKHRNRHISVGKGRTKFPSRRGGSNGGVDVKGDRRSGSVYSGYGEQASFEVNDTYKQFLDNLCVEGGSLIFKYGDNKKIVYEYDDQETIEGETVKSPVTPKSTLKERSGKPRQLNSRRRPTQEPSISIPRPATPPSREKASTTTNSHKLSISECKAKEKYRKNPSVWDELRNLLTEPFTQEEYDDLMEYVSVRKRVEIHRDSRSGGSVKYGGLGKSYLQHYEDLNAEIEKVRPDRHKVLNLLRMFKMYLMKIPSGAPKPWKEEYFKSIMPGQKLHGST